MLRIARALAFGAPLVMIGACASESSESGRERVCRTASGTDAERAALTVGSSRSSVALFGNNPEGSASFVCSGVLVGVRTVLTADHCLRDRDTWTLEVVFDADARSGTTTRQVVGRKRHPSRDLAAVTLDADADVAPLRWSEDLLGATHAKGMTVQGFGDPEAAKRCLRVSQSVSDLPFNPLLPQVTWVNARLDGEVCKGDSGGPLIVEVNGEPLVLGITSLAILQGNQCGSLVKLERLVSIDPWVMETTGTAPARIACPERLKDLPGCGP